MTVFQIAHRLLSQYEAGGAYVNLSLNSHLTDGLSREMKSSLTALLYKSVEKKLTYDYYISALSKRSIDKINPNTRDILRIGLCALLDMRAIPDHAAVNEAVKLATNKGERAFVNGILRAAAREKENLPLPDKEKNTPRYYSVYSSIPLATDKYFISLLGEASALELFEYINSSDRKVTLTVNTRKISVPDFIKKLQDQGYSVTRAKFSPVSVVVSGSFNRKVADGFESGEFFVQDEASALCATSVSAKAGELVIDVCSAP